MNNQHNLLNLSRRTFVKNMSLGALSIPLSTMTDHSLYEDKKLGVALVGLGRYALKLAEGIELSKYCKLTGIVTGTPAKAAEWSKKYNLPATSVYNYETFDRIADNKNIDVIYIVLPNGMHKEYALRAAKAGKHVIVEKPMAINAAESLEIIHACKKEGVKLAVGYRLHYEPYNMEMMRLGQKKIYGKVRLVESELGYNMTTMDPGDWHFNKKLSGGGSLQNLGVYCVQAARYILGEEPTAVTAYFGPNSKPELFKEVEESVHWTLEFASGALGHSTCSSAYPLDRLFASAEQNTFELNPAISYGPFRGWTRDGDFKFPVTHMQQVQMDEMAKVLLAGKDFPEHISGWEGYKDAKVIDATRDISIPARFVITPNPVLEYQDFRINLSDDLSPIKNVHILIYNFNGQLIRRIHPPHGHTHLSVLGLPRGMYTIVVRSDHGSMANKLLVM